MPLVEHFKSEPEPESGENEPQLSSCPNPPKRPFERARERKETHTVSPFPEDSTFFPSQGKSGIPLLSRRYRIKGIETILRQNHVLIDEILHPFLQGLTQSVRIHGTTRPLIIDASLSDVPAEVSPGLTYLSCFGPYVRWFYKGNGSLTFTDGRSLTTIDADRGEASLRIHASLLRFPRVITHSFLLTALLELLRGKNLFHLHAACMDKEGRGVLICGSHGSGKSTSAMTLMRAGWNYLADDFVLLGRDGNRVRAHALPTEFKIDRTFLPSLKETGPDTILNLPGTLPWERKLVLAPELLFGSAFVDETAPGKILFMETKGGSKTTIEKIGKKEAVLRMILSTPLMGASEDCAKGNLNILSELSSQADCFTLSASEDIIERPEILAEKIDEI